VNLGGWLLLEPGPSMGFFERFPRRNGTHARCEWDLMEAMRKRGALAALTEHRETFISKQDFIDIKAMGLNSVRLPFGYWVVCGCSEGEPYVGPALTYIDRAVDWAEELGLQLVLDLHGCPGGESHDAPCGHRSRPKYTWNWTKWRFSESVQVLATLALRYRYRSCITGIQVCNEPSMETPIEELCAYYDRAMTAIRQAGMSADRVAVILPCFQRDIDEVAAAFKTASSGKQENYCFDMHYYHCFGWYNDLTYRHHLEMIEEHRTEILQHPVCVGEWSLATGIRAANNRSLPKKEARAIFARAQRSVYDQASHGWFFWNYKDGAGEDWDWRLARHYEQGSLTCPTPSTSAQVRKTHKDARVDAENNVTMSCAKCQELEKALMQDMACRVDAMTDLLRASSRCRKGCVKMNEVAVSTLLTALAGSSSKKRRLG